MVKRSIVDKAINQWAATAVGVHSCYRTALSTLLKLNRRSHRFSDLNFFISRGLHSISDLLFCSCRSQKLAESTAADDVMSESTVVLMQEQVDSLCDTDTGEFSCSTISVAVAWLYNFWPYVWNLKFIMIHSIVLWNWTLKRIRCDKIAALLVNEFSFMKSMATLKPVQTSHNAF